MFSQLRQAVETFAPQPRRSIDEQPSVLTQDTHDRRTQSMDATTGRSASSTQLAESALLNLRKSLSSGRSGSPSPSTSPTHASRNVHLSLEERLRASFTIGEASTGTTPDVSTRASPSVDERPASPASTPLPQSPALDAKQHHVQPLTPPSTTPLSEEPDAELQFTEEPIDEEAHVPSHAELPTVAEEPAVIEDDVLESPSSSADPLGATVDIDSLQERLKLVEQRFSDVSKSFKRLQAEKLAADAILHELTPLESFKETDALRDYLQNLQSKTEISQQEIVRLLGKIAVQDERLEEIRDMHRLESKSQSEQIDTLRSRLAETEALFNASQSSVSQNEEDSAKHKAEVDKMQAEINKSNRVAKEEEEKRVKAISLLKTVRQKLVKAEKEREDALKEAAALKEHDKAEKEKDAGEKNQLKKELESLNVEKDRAVSGLRTHFEKEIAGIKERHERELIAMRGQFEMEAMASKNAHSRELGAKTSQISQLQTSLDSVTQDKNNFFDELQLRQAECESAQSLLETTQSQNSELQYRIRELEDRTSLLQEELSDSQAGQMYKSSEASMSSDELASILAAAEAKYETRLGELQRSLTATERERNDIEAEWSRKLREKAKETDDLKRALAATSQLREQHQAVTDELHKEIEQLKKDRLVLDQQRDEMRSKVDLALQSEASVRGSFAELETKIKTLEHNWEESKARESQLRANNKTLREELRKVQSSAALLEKQRNPGVGYWTNRGADSSQTDVRSSTSSESRVSSPKPDSNRDEEDVNIEYLRNVILQFLEHKEMRPNLVKVLSIILRFTPQETRRLMAKV